MEPVLLGSPREWTFIYREIIAKSAHKIILTCTAMYIQSMHKNLLLRVLALHDCHHEGLSNDDTHRVLKHVGDLMYLLCIDYRGFFITCCVKCIIIVIALQPVVR